MKLSTETYIFFVILLILSQILDVHLVTVKDIFTSNSEILKRVPRDNKYYRDRYEPDNTSTSSRTLKPEDNADSSNSKKDEKRCTTCDTGYLKPYTNTRGGSYDRYDDRYNDDRSYDRYDRPRYPSSSLGRDSYYDRYDRYDRDRYLDRDRYGGGSRDRYYDDYYDRDYGRDYGGGRDSVYGGGRDGGYGGRDGGYGGRDGGYGGRDRYYDRYDDRRDRNYDRGVGYDNRGYDYRSDGYRPWDQTSRGSSGFDLTGRGYYSAAGKPEYGSSGYGGGGYAKGWNYGGGRDDYRDRGYGSYGGYGGYGGGNSRSRDPYYDSGYRYTTSYLYGRPSSTTTDNPKLSDNTISGTSNPSQNSNNSR